ncbi:MAG: ABC transporter ATP-binding protein [Acidimicrobiia bacterium]|nr:ABC transporter ATP-binding protein [Acidimicrobiia bacterium]MYB45263.1 ABC transporter ATP-binding protein [Acidimicrobiia bacterium]MYC83996.1 ABC transporter ATP-binding protein [Acidimicrobiia bacterium]
MLRVSNLSSSYGNIRAVNNVDLQVDRGAMVSLIGSNGSGKSTTLKTIAGMHSPDSGTVTFGDRDITGWPTHQLAHHGLAFLMERPTSVVAPLTVEENLALGSAARRSNVPEMLARIFELFPRLKERRRQYAGTLSGGEQQMVAIGRVLITDPELLLIDSPTIGLAPAIVDEVYASITRLHAEGLSILFIEQNAELALAISDHTYLLHRGSISIEGPSATLRNSQEIIDAYLA